MFWGIIFILFMLYVVYSLSKINHQLSLISKLFEVKEEDEDIINASDEEIERELNE